MVLIIGILMTLLGFMVYSASPLNKIGNAVLDFYFFWVFVLPYLVDFVIPMSNEGMNYYDFITWSQYFCILLFPMVYSQFGKKNALPNGIYIIFAIIFFYAFFLGVYRGAIIQVPKYVVFNYLPVLMLMNILYLRPDKKKVFKTIKRLLVLELLVGGIQLLGFGQYSVNQNASDFDFARMTGTFTGNNIYAEVLTMLIFSVIYDEFTQKHKITLKYWLLVSVGFMISLLSGIRTALIGYVLCMLLFVCLLYKDNPKAKRIIFAVLILGGLYFVRYLLEGIVNDDMVYDSQTSNASERQGTLLNLLRDDSYLTEHTTFYLTVFVLSYLGLDYLFGPGLLFTSTAGYGGVVNLTTENETDAAMAIYICETGIIGVLLFFIFYYYILRYISKSVIPSVFFLYLMLTFVTDLGPTFLPCSIFFYIILYSESDLQSVKFESHS